MTLPFGPAAQWTLEPETAFLNHGSFGACPIPVLETQERLRRRMEAQPVRFMVRELEGLLDAARGELGAFLGADPDDLAFLPNTTTGVSTVLAALKLAPGDEVLTTSHVYRAVHLALDRALAAQGANLVLAQIPFPISGPDDVIDAVLAAVTPRTRFAVLDHITSPTALIFPIQALVAALARRGIETLVDGAHAAGQVPVFINELGAAYYVGNCHKWLCAPKGAAFLHVRKDLQAELHPLVISHGAGSTRTDRSRFRLEFDWPGTIDFSAYLSVPAAIEMGNRFGGWENWMALNHELALEGRRILCEALGVEPACPPEMVGAMAAVALPPGPGEPPQPPFFQAALQETLFRRYHIEVPIMAWPVWPARWVRISAQRYNDRAQYEMLARALVDELASQP